MKFSVGDKVKVLEDARRRIIKMGQRGPGWVEDMSKTLGEIGNIICIENGFGANFYAVSCAGVNDVYEFPASCLMLVENKTEEKKTKVDKIVTYTIKTTVGTEEYETVCDKIREIGEIVGDDKPKRIPIVGKIKVHITSIDDIQSFASCVEEISELTTDEVIVEADI